MSSGNLLRLSEQPIATFKQKSEPHVPSGSHEESISGQQQKRRDNQGSVCCWWEEVNSCDIIKDNDM